MEYENRISMAIKSTRTEVIEAAMVIIGVLQMAISAFDTLYFNRSLAGDVEGVWIPFANQVLAGGAPYLAHWDNKPPLFQFLNIAFAASDHYVILFYITIGLVNGISAVLLWRLCRQYGYRTVGLVAGVIFLAFMPISSFRINPRQYATMLSLLALLSTSSLRSGAYIAAAGLFSQFSALLIPAILWLRYPAVDNPNRWTAKFIAAGLAVVALVFSIVAAVWSVEAAVTGFEYSFLDSGEYVNDYNQREISLFGDPIGWVYRTYRLFTDWMVLLFGAVAGSLVVAVTNRYNARRFGTTMIFAALLMLSQMTIRQAPVYSISWVPFLAVLTAIAGAYVFRGGGSVHN